MKLQVKSTLILVGTLLIGMVLGALVLGSVQRTIYGDFKRTPRQDRFSRMMTRMIDPAPEQVEPLNELMERYGPKFAEQYQRHSAEMKELFDSLHEELEPILTEEQLARLKERMARFKAGPRGKGQRRHPAGDPPPPPPSDDEI